MKKKNQIKMSTTQFENYNIINAVNTDNTDNGLSFEVHEIEYEDDSVPSVCPGGPLHHQIIPGLELYDESPMSDDTPSSPFPLMRSTSSSMTSPTASMSSSIPRPSFQCSPAMATADGMCAPPVALAPPTIRTHPNVKRLQFGENPETIATLKFLESQGIDITGLVAQHIIKYGSRARIAETCDGEVVGFIMFDNEIDQEQIRDMATYCHVSEIREFVDKKPFIFLQMLIMDPEFVTNTLSGIEWKRELVAQFCDCVTRNGKIAIARTETSNKLEIDFYRSCGFFTMHDMDIPSYPSSKGADITILAYTPLGKIGTAEIFKKFYSMGARF